MRRKTLCLDFDGVIHSYVTGWSNATTIPDPPVQGALEFINEAVEHFTIVIFSSRSAEPGAIYAMKDWLREHLEKRFGPDRGKHILLHIGFPITKPSAFVTLDDRAIQFNGVFPSIDVLSSFKPWHKKD